MREGRSGVYAEHMCLIELMLVGLSMSVQREHSCGSSAKIKVTSTGELDNLPAYHNNIGHNYRGGS